MSKVASLSNFIASKKDATPAPLEAEKPASKAVPVEPQPAPVLAEAVSAPAPPAKVRRGRGAAKPDPAAADKRTALNARVDPVFHRSLKVYAARMGIDISEIIREGVELYRKKYGEPAD